MELIALLLKEHSKRNGMEVAKHIQEDPKIIDDVINLLSSESIALQQRAPQALCYAVEYLKVTLTCSQIAQLVQILKKVNLHNAVPRNILKIIELNGNVADQDKGFLFDYCIDTITSSNNPIASRAFAVPVAHKLVIEFPDLQQELKEVLLSLSDLESPGIQFRKKKYLQLLP